MSGYYVRLAKANNDEFINVKRRVVVVGGGGWGEARKATRVHMWSTTTIFFINNRRKGDIKNRKRRDSRSSEGIFMQNETILIYVDVAEHCQWRKRVKIYVVRTCAAKIVSNEP